MVFRGRVGSYISNSVGEEIKDESKQAILWLKMATILIAEKGEKDMPPPTIEEAVNVEKGVQLVRTRPHMFYPSLYGHPYAFYDK